jgi:preprotein translocase SecE subunit
VIPVAGLYLGRKCKETLDVRQNQTWPFGIDHWGRYLGFLSAGRKPTGRARRCVYARVGVRGAGGLDKCAWKSVFVVYARESVIETRKVVWPTRKETMQSTGLVLAFVFVMAVFLWGVDSILASLIRLLLGTET